MRPILSSPTYYSLELTPVCDNCCPACSNVFTRNQAPLSALEWQQILRHIALHASLLKLTGGEPTLHPEFADIIHAVAETSIPFTLFTNARWSSPQTIIDLLLRSTPQNTGMLVSLHGPNASAHEAFTNTPDSFEETCRNIRRAAEAGLRIHTSTVLTRYNWDRVSETVALAQILGAKRAVFNRYLGPSMPDLEPEKWQLRQAMSSIEELRRKRAGIDVKYGNCIPQCFAPSSSTGCRASVAYCTIDPWGNMRPCNHSPLVLGNVLETPIEELWHSEAMNRWRALLPAECEACGELAVCHGGCRAMIEIRDLKRDPLARGPLPAAEHEPRQITLFEGARPKTVCRIRSEEFGYALIRGAHFVPVTHHAKPILDTLDGQKTLSEIQHQFGQEALDFVGTLCLQGLVELA